LRRPDADPLVAQTECHGKGREHEHRDDAVGEREAGRAAAAEFRDAADRSRGEQAADRGADVDEALRRGAQRSRRLVDRVGRGRSRSKTW